MTVTVVVTPSATPATSSTPASQSVRGSVTLVVPGQGGGERDAFACEEDENSNIGCQDAVAGE